MKKLLMISMTLLLFSGCTTYKDITKDPKFSTTLTKTFQTVDDFILAKLRDEEEIVAEKIDCPTMPTREEISENKTPFNYKGDVIYGILEKGARFKIVKIALRHGFEFTLQHYEAEILSEGPFKGKRIDITQLMDYDSNIPIVLGGYAVEVKP